MPQIAMIAGSLRLRITPSQCGVPATRRTKLPAGAGTHDAGSKSLPLLHHHVPDMTMQKHVPDMTMQKRSLV